MFDKEREEANNLELLRNERQRLINALANGASIKRLLQLWSKFIRLRDGYKCVFCDDEDKIAAHHICRKSLLPFAQFESGNGITLCGSCHKDVHKGFNGRPDLTLPMDAQGGEKIETMSWLYSALEDNARCRGLLGDEFYYLSDATLFTFKKFQSYEKDTYFPGCRLEQANLIWRVAPLAVLNAILGANVLPEQTEPFLPGITFFYD